MKSGIISFSPDWCPVVLMPLLLPFQMFQTPFQGGVSGRCWPDLYLFFYVMTATRGIYTLLMEGGHVIGQHKFVRN